MSRPLVIPAETKIRIVRVCSTDRLGPDRGGRAEGEGVRVVGLNRPGFPGGV